MKAKPSIKKRIPVKQGIIAVFLCILFSPAVSNAGCAVPTVAFTASSTSPCTGSTVTFADGSFQGGAVITAWTWSFSPATVTYQGGTTSASQHPQVSFNTAGSYSVTLRVDNACPSFSTLTKPAYITVGAPPPVAAFTGSPTSVCPGGTVAFTDQSSNTPTSWSWTFQNGTPGTSTAQNPSVTYSTVGTYSVALTATNTCGSSAPLTKTGYITVWNMCPGTAINTTGSSSNPSAILDISSTAQGILIPRMTTAQRQALKDPAAGLIIYNTTSNAINFYNGTGWQGVQVNSVSVTSAAGTGPGQGMAINKTGAVSDASAILDVSATDKGLLIPRTTQGAVTAVTGLIIYNTTTDNINFYDGTSWQTLCSTFIDNIKGTGAVGSGISISATGAAADVSAILDISSSTQGLLIPRVTSAQRDIIKTPAQGLVIYDNTNNRIEHWTGAGNWYEWMVSSVPAAPTANAGTNITCTSFSANWTAVAGATTYYLDVSTVSTFTVFVGIYNNLDVGNVTTRSVTGLTAGTTYYYRVRVSTACGTSANSNTITVTTTATPAVPTATAATSITGTSFSANWTASAGATTYYLDVSTVSTFASFVGTYNNLNVGNVITYSVTGLTAGVTYYYRVRASNACGTSANSNTITVTTCEAAVISTSNSCSGTSYTWTRTVTVAGWIQEATYTGGCTTGIIATKWVAVGYIATGSWLDYTAPCGGVGGVCGNYSGTVGKAIWGVCGP